MTRRGDQDQRNKPQREEARGKVPVQFSVLRGKENYSSTARWGKEKGVRHQGRILITAKGGKKKKFWLDGCKKGEGAFLTEQAEIGRCPGGPKY